MIARRLSLSKKKINHQNKVICFKKIYNKWLALIGKKNVEDSIKDGLIITTGAARIFFGLKAASVKLPSLDAMFIIKLAGRTVGGAFIKDYVVFKKWINE